MTLLARWTPTANASTVGATTAKTHLPSANTHTHTDIGDIRSLTHSSARSPGTRTLVDDRSTENCFFFEFCYYSVGKNRSIRQAVNEVNIVKNGGVNHNLQATDRPSQKGHVYLPFGLVHHAFMPIGRVGRSVTSRSIDRQMWLRTSGGGGVRWWRLFYWRFNVHMACAIVRNVRASVQIMDQRRLMSVWIV